MDITVWTLILAGFLGLQGTSEAAEEVEKRLLTNTPTIDTLGQEILQLNQQFTQQISTLQTKVGDLETENSAAKHQISELQLVLSQQCAQCPAGKSN